MFVHYLDPVAFQFFGLEIRYYGLIYAAGLLLAYWWMMRHVRRHRVMSREQADSLFLWIIVGVLVGARLFEILLYHPSWYFSHPVEMIALWHGGLSFHGGLVGAVFAAWLFARRAGLSLLQLGDILVVPASLALGFGRLANFINGELYGRVTTVAWGVVFPQVDSLLRHPSQLYEAAKNFLLFAFLHVRTTTRHRDGEIFALFLLGYGVLRFVVEFFREPEVVVGVLTMGQLLSGIMILLGVGVLWRVYHER